MRTLGTVCLFAIALFGLCIFAGLCGAFWGPHNTQLVYGGALSMWLGTKVYIGEGKVSDAELPLLMGLQPIFFLVGVTLNELFSRFWEAVL